jgi:transposase-like protein
MAKAGQNINKNHFIQVRSYKCECGNINQTSLDSFVEKGYNYTKRIKNTCIHVNYRGHMSFANIVSLISHFQDVAQSRQTVYNKLRKYYGKLKLSNHRIRNYSGNYAYDEQYIKLNGVKYYIFSTI